jgi:hypothetical protein
MNTVPTPIPVSVSNELQGPEQTRLHGHWLTLARMAWVSSLIVLLSLFVPLLPSYFALLHSLCTNAVCTLVQPTPATVQAMQKLGFS